MNRVSFVSGSTFDAERLRRQLGGIFEVECVDLAQLRDFKPERFAVVAANLNDPTHLLDLKEWMKAKPKDGKAVFVTHAGSHLETAQACALGATDVVQRPLDGKALLKIFLGDLSATAGDASQLKTEAGPAVAAAHDGLKSVFSAACLDGPLDAATVSTAGAAVVNEIESKGLSAWIDAVRKHHCQTYQHCLLVTGTAVAFGRHLGLSEADRNRLSFAGMLHDIGKARIPLAILEKPGPLDAAELAVMRKHPEYGQEALTGAQGVTPEMIDMVVHHHEYLDGSGYPHGLKAAEIADLVRIITISDVFGALIERRSYKPPLSSQKAYDILVDMGPKLDKDLLREFSFVVKAAA
jgi:putative nucleotidyltransferase with HDIG domain